LISKLNDMMVRQQCGYTLITQPERRFIASNIPEDKFKIFDNEVYEFKPVKTLKIAHFTSEWVLNNVYDWLQKEDDGQWINQHCKNIYFEVNISPEDYMLNCRIAAYIKPCDNTFYRLKFSA
jgi:hypothetical protein